MAKKLKLIPLEEKTKTLTNSYVRLEKFIKNKLSGIKSFSARNLRKTKNEIMVRIDEQDIFNERWANENIPIAYNESSAITKKNILKLPGNEDIDREPKKKVFEKVKEKEIDRSIEKTLVYMDEANDSYRFAINTFFKHLAKVKKRFDIQNFVDHWGDSLNMDIDDIKEWSLVPTTRVTRAGYQYDAIPVTRDVKKRVSKAFADAFGDFDFIQVPLKSGGYRNYNPTKYFNMVARTELRNIQTVALLDRSRQYENDLIQISTHQNPCRICVPFEGQIYSISGKSKTYPPLFDSPPFHPHCEHSAFPQNELNIKLNKDNPMVPNPPKPKWGLTVESWMKELSGKRAA